VQCHRAEIEYKVTSYNLVENKHFLCPCGNSRSG
jgi:hypothetical protein